MAVDYIIIKHCKNFVKKLSTMSSISIPNLKTNKNIFNFQQNIYKILLHTKLIAFYFFIGIHNYDALLLNVIYTNSKHIYRI